jgi:hypothetical protein
MARRKHPFVNLEAAIFFCGIDKKILAKMLNMNYGSLLNKINGDNEFTLKEMEKIRDLVIREYKGDSLEIKDKLVKLDYLFDKEVSDGEKL